MRRARIKGERGAIAVEAAFVTPVLILMMFGIVELALIMRDVASVSSAVHSGSRIGSTAAGAGPGTCQASANPPPCTPASAPAFAQAAADAIQRAGSAMPADSIEWVMIYDANALGFPMPEGNSQLVCSSNCVTYVWDKGLGKFRFASGAWASTSVNACVNDPAQNAIGVAMRADHAPVTGIFGTIPITERSVMKFEPLPTAQCKPNTHA